MNDTELDLLLDRWKAPEPPPSMRAALRSRFPVKPTLRFLGVRPRWIAASAAIAVALALGASLLQDGTIASDAGPWDPGTYLRRTRIVHPYLAKLIWGRRSGRSTGWQWQGVKLAGSVYLFDKSTRVHYGYTWNAEPLANRRYRFTVLPLDPSVLKEDGPIAPLARPTPPVIVAPGSTFEVDLYSSGTERVYDRYELSAQPLPLPTPENNPDRITLANPHLYVNGAFTLDSGGVVEAAGDTVTVQLRGRGAFTLTLNPHGDARFLLAGSANGSTIEFRVGADVFRVACTAPVAQGGDRPVYLYVKEDPNLTSSGFRGGGGPGPAPGGPAR